GADIVVHSATKYIDGQGRVLGGAVIGRRAYIADTLGPFLRTMGPTMSPFNAWILLKGCETLSVRMYQQSANALEVARWLEAQPAIEDRKSVVEGKRAGTRGPGVREGRSGRETRRQWT